MTLEELIEIVVNSKQDEWNVISCWGANGGPSFKDRFNFWNVYEGDTNVLTYKSFPDTASYKPNLSITMAWGLNVYENDKDGRVDRPWATCFPDPSPGHSDFLDLYFNNALVFRISYVSVDGGRCKIPFPYYREDGTTYCHRLLTDFMRSVNRITSMDNFDFYFNQTGIEIINEEWRY